MLFLGLPHVSRPPRVAWLIFPVQERNLNAGFSPIA
jgi:hypothetical protein